MVFWEGLSYARHRMCVFFFTGTIAAFLVGWVWREVFMYYIRDGFFMVLVLYVLALHDDKTLKCSQICSLYGVIMGISHSLVYHSLSIGD
jgi:disulfide bond formation protein DsbB